MTPRHALLAFVALAVVTSPLTSPSIGGQARDRVVEPTGSAVIAGRVVADVEPAGPMRRALVTVAGGGLSSSRSAITGDDGRFAIGGLPAGRYTVTAQKPAFLAAAFGARRPGRAGTPIVVVDGQQTDIEIRIARGAVVEGVLRDEAGRPIVGAEVQAVDPKDPGSFGMPLDTNPRTATTDDRGLYRIYGLRPGTYVIATSITAIGTGELGRRRDAEVDAIIEAARRRATQAGAPFTPPAPPPVVGYPLTYYPGVGDFGSAMRIDLRAGDERLGLDFAVVPSAAVSVDGVVARSDAEPPSAVSLSLDLDGPRVFRSGTAPSLEQPPDDQGRFRYTGILPGHYRIYARSRATTGSPAGPIGLSGRGGMPPATRSTSGPVPLFAIAEFDVLGQDISGLSLLLVPGVILNGRVVFDGAVATNPPADLSAVRINVRLPRGSYSSMMGGTTMGTSLVGVATTSAAKDGTFVVRGIAPGEYRFSVNVPDAIAERWWLRSAMLGDRDLLDALLEVDQADLADVVLTFTDRRTELAGTLQSATGLPAPEYFVVVFPADRTMWHAGSRRITSARPDTTGAFSMRDLPPGAYLLAALTDLESADLEDERFLEEMAAQAILVAIVEGERTEQNLRIAR
ncbi:MAG TPA: carboxypeptidase-like regulatory domain-containing protein [Vicinamibacterales bacterium]|nr:carboxypeptidase-like regulatory domain-containing protein [Vicinamibacterales bacterium]